MNIVHEYTVKRKAKNTLPEKHFFVVSSGHFM